MQDAGRHSRVQASGGFPWMVGQSWVIGWVKRQHSSTHNENRSILLRPVLCWNSNPGFSTSQAITLEAELCLPAVVLVLYFSDASLEQFETFLDSMSTNQKWRPRVCECDLFSIVCLCQLQEGVIKWPWFSHQTIRWHGSCCSLISWPWISHL